LAEAGAACLTSASAKIDDRIHQSGPMMKKVTSVLLVASITLLSLALQKYYITQPVAYNHNLHVVENDMDCLDCHRYAERNARASIPNIEVCIDCHEEAVSESPAEAALLNYISENKLIPWRQVYEVPDHAYFSHRRHVKLGRLECSTCHGDISKQTTPIVAPVTEVVMEWCIECHKQRNVSTDCYACHR